MPMSYPTAADLARLDHCSACGMTNPEESDGLTECCAKRSCAGMDPTAQDACCSAVQERMEAEAQAPRPAGRPAAPAPVAKKPKKAKARRSPQKDVTRGLHDSGSDANLVSHTGGAAPTKPEPKEPDMSKAAPNTKHTALTAAERSAAAQKRAEQAAKDYENGVGGVIKRARVRQEAKKAAEAAATAPAKPKTARRAAQGEASVTGWELLYDKPKHNCEVGRRYTDGKAEYALICKEHKHVHPVARLTSERSVRAAGGWCPDCK